MESVLGRYRNLIVLVGVLFLQVLGLAIQVKRGTDTQNSTLIRIWAVDAITPLERCVVWVQHGFSDVWHNYFYLRGVRAENRQLKEQIEQMRLEQVRLSQDAEQAHRLQALLSFKEQFIAKTVAAQVIGSSGSDASRVLYIDKGVNEGVDRDMAVVTADGVVGKVWETYGSVSKILLINDVSSGVGAILEKSRLQGVVKGTATGEVGLEHVMRDEPVELGDRVLTSGGDGIFPKGLPVGTVAKVSPGKELFLSIKVKPATDLSRLEEVLIVTEKQDRAAVASDKGAVRAADILAQRLPSVPPKPPADAAKPASGTNAGAATTTPPPSQAVANGGKKPSIVPVAGTQNAAAAVAPTVATPKPAAPKPAAPKAATPAAAKVAAPPAAKPTQGESGVTPVMPLIPPAMETTPKPQSPQDAPRGPDEH